MKFLARDRAAGEAENMGIFLAKILISTRERRGFLDLNRWQFLAMVREGGAGEAESASNCHRGSRQVYLLLSC